MEHGYTQHGDYEEAVTPEAFRVISKVKAFTQSFNYDDSDGMIDYFDYRGRPGIRSGHAGEGTIIHYANAAFTCVPSKQKSTQKTLQRNKQYIER